MKKNRAQIEFLKRNFRDELTKDVNKFKSAIVRELEYLYRSYKSVNSEFTFAQFETFVQQRFQIPQTQKNIILSELKRNQVLIADVWSSSFNILTDSYENLLAAYRVDFAQIDQDVRNAVNKQIRNAAVQNNISFSTFRQNLVNSGVGTHQAYTLANTALAQFDNASMFEFAKQSGTDKFIYDGVINQDSRAFCVQHFQKVYTHEEILQLDNGQGLPVITSCGGYNCTHYWTPKDN